MYIMNSMYYLGFAHSLFVHVHFVVRVFCCVVWCGQAAVFTGHTSMELLWRPFSFSQPCPHPLYSMSPPSPFFPPTLHCCNAGHPAQTLAPHPTTSTAWHHVNHGRHPFSQRSPRSLLSGSACPEVLGKLMQIQENLAHRLLLPNLWSLWIQCWHTNTQSFGWEDNWLNEVQFR